MFYEFDFTIPANTPATSPHEEEVELEHGRIVGVEVQFPRGCVGLVHVWVRRELHQLWPTNPDGTIKAEEARISWQEDHPFTEEPYTLTLCGWNVDDSFPHTPTFRFNLLPLSRPEPPPPESPLERFTLEVLEIA
jgi:hypothetical protein